MSFNQLFIGTLIKTCVLHFRAAKTGFFILHIYVAKIINNMNTIVHYFTDLYDCLGGLWP